MDPLADMPWGAGATPSGGVCRDVRRRVLLLHNVGGSRLVADVDSLQTNTREQNSLFLNEPIERILTAHFFDVNEDVCSC